MPEAYEPRRVGVAGADRGWGRRGPGGRRTGSPEVAAGLAAEAAAQASAALSAPWADCCRAGQESELVELECVLAPGGTPHGSTEEAGLAPVGRQAGLGDALRKSWAAGVRGPCEPHWDLCPVSGEADTQRALSHTSNTRQSQSQGWESPTRPAGTALGKEPQEQPRTCCTPGHRGLLAKASPPPWSAQASDQGSAYRPVPPALSGLCL